MRDPVILGSSYVPLFLETPIWRCRDVAQLCSDSFATHVLEIATCPQKTISC